ncbi:Putative O-methyltransferase COMT-type [Colletotrichum destructivum]|uniref:O-methyltransferase COMT-type n=1 Tax=Colletotrichum destructivum TaxID=34406 RepID=A0AAX4ICB2_9PEZI|nr:Putative O-methyltransferase COMT-type [Colletotrichum destructivum]
MQGTDMHHLLLHRLNEGLRSASREPDALRQSGYRNPKPDDASSFNLPFGYEGTYWDYIANVGQDGGDNFNQAMTAVTINNLDEIPKLYLFASLDEDGGLIVDVCGGRGQFSREILIAHPRAGLRCVVQYKHALASENHRKSNNVYDNEPSDLVLTLQEHEFLFESSASQDIAAAACLFRHFFHDWPDQACVEILRQIVTVMDERAKSNFDL